MVAPYKTSGQNGVLPKRPVPVQLMALYGKPTMGEVQDLSFLFFQRFTFAHRRIIAAYIWELARSRQRVAATRPSGLLPCILYSCLMTALPMEVVILPFE